MQVTRFFDAMMAPMPAEISQFNVSALVRWAHCAMLDVGTAIAATSATAAKPIKRLCISLSLFSETRP
jgi:hypothetical protein